MKRRISPVVLIIFSLLLASCQTVIRGSVETGATVPQSMVYFAEALDFDSQQEIDAAIGDYERSIERLKTPGDLAQKRDLCARLGWLYFQVGQYPQAEFYLTEAIMTAEACGLNPGFDYSTLGEVYTMIGNYEKAKECYKGALRTVVAGDQKEGQSDDDYLYELCKNVRIFKSPKEIVSKIYIFTHAITGLVTTYYFQGDYEKCVKFGEIGITYHDSMKKWTKAMGTEKEWEMFCFSNGIVRSLTGHAYTKLGAVDKGEALALEGLGWFESVGYPYGRSIGMGIEALCLVEKGRLTEALEMVTDLADLAQENELVEVKWRIGSEGAAIIMRISPQFDKMIAFLEEKRSGGDIDSRGLKGDELTGLLMSDYKPDEGDEGLLAYYLASPNIGQQIQNSHDMFFSLFEKIYLKDKTNPHFKNIAALHSVSERLSEKYKNIQTIEGAIDYIGAQKKIFLEYSYELNLDSIENFENTRAKFSTDLAKSSFLNNKRAVYENMVLVCLALGRGAEALEFAERAKARALIDLLESKSVSVDLKGPRDLQQEHRDLIRSIEYLKAHMDNREVERLRTSDGAARGSLAAEESSIRRELELKEREYGALTARIRRVDPELASLISVTTLSSDEIVALTRNGFTIIEYFVTETGVVVWVVNRNGISSTVLPVGVAELKGLIESFRKGITGLGDYRAEGRAGGDAASVLYKLLIDPIRTRLADERLCIIPHDILHYVPFHALFDGNAYLIEKYTIFYAPSATVLGFCMNRPERPSDGILAFGNPTVDVRYPDLPYAEREAEGIARLYARAGLYLKDKATETKLVDGSHGYRVVHLACHGIYDERDPLLSRLILSKDEKNDGDLTAIEIFSLDLDADLVTLSACQSGLGTITRGDEIIGLNRSFFYAGALSIVASLWSVADDSTAIFMESFYEGLKTHDKAWALRNAQIEVMRTYPEPFFWAPFFLTGDYQ